MATNIYTLLGLIISTILLMFLYLFIKDQKKKSEVKKSFLYILLLLIIWCLGLIAQITLSEVLNIKPIYFDYIVYIGIVFVPIPFLSMSIHFVSPSSKINIKKLCTSLCILPVICLIGLWTNDFHHLFYIKYSTMLSDGIYGPLFYITSAYTYLLLLIAFIILIIYSIKNIKFYFIQGILICLGALIPLIINIIGVLDIIPVSIYITPMSFSLTTLLFAVSIFRFGFLKITPIALKKIVNRISDSYLVLNDDFIVIDFNDTFIKTFSLQNSNIINNNFLEIQSLPDNFKEIHSKLLDVLKNIRNIDSTIEIDEYFEKINKYFHIEINTIMDNNTYLGTLLLFKDVTQHQIDLQTIKNNQDILVERERLASLGQLIGGIAHNLKTPIMSISGATEGLEDLIKEYRASVGDPEVTFEDHNAIADDMYSWITKIRSYTEYMSDIITTVKGQAVALSNEGTISFSVDELVKRVDILMKHELKNALISLNVIMENVDPNTTLHGNVNALVQVINNMISNAIQAYQGKTGEKIDLIISKQENNIIFSVKDNAGGLSKKVQDKLFKEMITTKGKNGSGLGLFMSHSNIRAHFNGNITYTTEEGKGTTFNIIIPM